MYIYSRSMKMNIVLVKHDLLFPPSEIGVFRDITLYTKMHTNYNILIESSPEHIDTCFKYMMRTGAFDYVDDIVKPGEEHGVLISDTRPCSVHVRRFWAGNLHRVLRDLQTVL